MLSTALLLAASMTAGQPVDSVDPNLKQLTPLVGTWHATFDWPGLAVKEAKVTYRWVLDGKYLEARWSSMDGTDLGPELFAWDPDRKSIRMWGFDSESFYEAIWRVEGKKWTGEYSGTKFSGEKTKDTFTIEFKDDSLALGTQVVGEAKKPGGTAKFTRVRSED